MNSNICLYDNKYKLIKKIGSGSFGEVYIGENIENNTKVAIKLEKIEESHAQLRNEYTIYNALRNERGIPRVYWFGLNLNNRVLVMDFIGPSLDNIYNNNRDCFNINGVLKLGINILELIERVHESGIIHRDIKPANFLMNRNSELYIIDFGLSKFYRNSDNTHIPYGTKKKFTGTPRYSSKNNHNGIEQSRRDDMESIGYVIIYLMKGRLPWQGLDDDKKTKYSLILNKKETIDISELCKNLPKQIVTYMNYVNSLQFEDCPNYDYLKGLFYSATKDLEKSLHK
jgi:serine/threonine protein kinase